jgi:hypothetical protein
MKNKRDLLLWVLVLLSPLAWLCSFEAKFAWAPWVCVFQVKAALFVISLAAFLLCGGSALVAWREWKALGADSGGDGGNTLARSQFMALGAMVFGAGFAMVVVAQAIPDLVLGACQ